MLLPKPYVVFTHESDLDGFVAGHLLHRLAKMRNEDHVRFEAYNYENWPKRLLNESGGWICDLAFEPRMDKPNWLVVDHHPHKTIPKAVSLIHDSTKSASLLACELCNKYDIQNSALDRLVHLTNIADLFLVDDPDFDIACDYANLIKTYGFWNMHSIINGELEQLLDHPLIEVMSTKRKVEDPIGFQWSLKNIIPITPNIGCVNLVVGNSNLLIHKLLHHESVPFDTLVTLTRRNQGSVAVSLRSKNGKAADIAKKLHGGGHPNAAGAILPRFVQRLQDGIDYLRKTLDPAHPTNPPIENLETIFEEIESSK
ncbi:MAG: DHH family phosphoesterase [Verrucomicrobia bacterium]|nr:DHH family phosphoesterase [Verrucomicrobiota bacterium]